MTTELFLPNDDLEGKGSAASLVVDEAQGLIGIVTYIHLLRYFEPSRGGLR